MTKPPHKRHDSGELDDLEHDRVSANFHHDALHHESDDALEAAIALDGPLADDFAQRSPDGREHWPVVAAKGLKMGAEEEPTFTASELTAITVPTLVIGADDDAFPTSHTVELFDALPDARLSVIPNTSHLLAMERPDLIAPYILEFLQAPTRQPTMMPMKRPVG